MTSKQPYSEAQPFNLNPSNYYSEAANWHYMSVSQFKAFDACEAGALAELKGEWSRDGDATPLLVGNFVHSYFESDQSHAAFKKENQDTLFRSPTVAEIKKTLDAAEIVYKKTAKKEDLIELAQDHDVPVPYGELLAPFLVGETMIDRVAREPLFGHIWQGERESIVTGELYGVRWKGKIDLLNVAKTYFVDLKTTADLHKRIYSPKYGGWVSFVEEYGYILQVAVYEQLLEKKYGKPFNGLLYAVTKQSPPDVCAIKPDDRQREFELLELESKIGRISQVKHGEVRPTMCGKCAYCRSIKKLTKFSTTADLID